MVKNRAQGIQFMIHRFMNLAQPLRKHRHSVLGTQIPIYL